MIYTDFNTFTTKIKHRLTLPLPGEAAHAQMAAGSRNLEFHPKSDARESAVLILFFFHKGEVFFPLILRPAYEGVHGGQMAFPGGRMERIDKSLIHTALREAQEEVGIKASDVTVLGELTRFYIPPSNFWVKPVVGVIQYRPEFYPDPREVADVFEISLGEIMPKEVRHTEKRTMNGISFDAPYFLLREQRVWGATAAMLAELVEVIEEANL